MLSFFKKHTLPLISCAAAFVSCFFVAPSLAYVDYIDFRTICCLFCISATVNALMGTGLFDRLARNLVRTLKTQRACVSALVAITLVGSMFITNDMALLTFLPLSFLVLNNTTQDRLVLPWCFVLQNAAAVLGGMILPFGNPHNLYLYNLFEIPTAAFALTMLPTFATAVALIAIGCLAVKPLPLSLEAPKKPIDREVADQAQKWEVVTDTQRIAHSSSDSLWHKLTYAALFLLTLGAILHFLPYPAVTGIVIIVISFSNRWVLGRVDYGLLITFVAFFIFAGNMSNLPAVERFMVGMLEKNQLFATVITCQIISNLPATLLLAPFTSQWPTLLVATDIAGMGTPIASLASLITIKAFMGYRREDTALFMKLFLAVGFGMLLVLYGVAAFTLP